MNDNEATDWLKVWTPKQEQRKLKWRWPDYLSAFQHPLLGKAAKAVGKEIAADASMDGKDSRWTVAELMQRTGYTSPTSVKKAKRALEDLGWIVLAEQGSNIGGRNRAATYDLVDLRPADLVRMDSVRRQPERGQCFVKGSIPDGQEVNGCAERGQSTHAKGSVAVPLQDLHRTPRPTEKDAAPASIATRSVTVPPDRARQESRCTLDEGPEVEESPPSAGDPNRNEATAGREKGDSVSMKQSTPEEELRSAKVWRQAYEENLKQWRDEGRDESWHMIVSTLRDLAKVNAEIEVLEQSNDEAWLKANAPAFA